MAKTITEDELKLVWLSRFNGTVKEISKLLPNRSFRSTKHLVTKLRKIKPEHEVYIKENIYSSPAPVIDDVLNLDGGTTGLYCRIKGLKYTSKSNGTTQREIDILKKYQDFYTYQEIADNFGYTESRVRNLASNLGLWKKFEWTEKRIKKVIELINSGKTLEEIDEYFERNPGATRVMLNLNNLHEYVPYSEDSVYHASKPEVYIINRINQEFNTNIPEKNRENQEYFWGVIPPYEIDIPFYINKHKFAIEYHAKHWHSSEKVKENDRIKKQILEENDFHYFLITDEMYARHNLSNMDPILDKICNKIRETIK